MFFIKSIFLILYIKLTLSELIFDLNGNDWTVRDENNDYTDLPASVPGGIYTDLMRNNILDDIFYKYNEDTYRWVPRKKWIYSKNFSVEVEDDPNNSILQQENINIVFDGVDTFAEIYLNDVKIGETSNMFLRYIFNIKDVLQEGNNYIEVRFQSPIQVGENLANEQNKSYVIPPQCPPDQYNGECNVNMLRKMQASYSWDWGPSFPSVGIWKNAYIEAFDQSAIRYVLIDTQEEIDTPLGDMWTMNVDTYLANNSVGSIAGTVMFSIDLKPQNLAYEYDVRTTLAVRDDNEIVSSIKISFSKDLIEPWWPNGYGPQTLYSFNVSFQGTKSYVSERQLKIGFRKVELIQEELDSGLTFYFKINDVPIFMKGSNEIPVNILPELGQDKATIRYLLESARDVNMNTLRVWGGGVYESDYFYEVADELGIMIWQDFMFACALYPTNEEYLENVAQEVRHQVKRLKYHPSVVVFSGNNENEGIIAFDWFGVGENISIYKNDYVTLYHDIIEAEFLSLAGNDSVFITSSPTNGLQTIADSYISSNPLSSYYGDVHFYNYELNPLDSNNFPIPRFASEYGYQSLPSVEAFKTASNDSNDYLLYSDFMEHRQHHPNGILELFYLMDSNLDVSSVGNDYETVIFYSQILQAMAYKIETERYRSRKSILSEDGRGYTMGALYWQLNDVWVAPTWAGIDFTGRWKMLHYFAKDFFAPVIITGEIDESRNLNIYAVSDLVAPQNLEVSLTLYNWASLQAISVENFTISLNSLESAWAATTKIDSYLSSRNCGSTDDAKNNCFIFLSAFQNGSLIAPHNFVFPTVIKNSNIPIADVQISSVEQTDDENTFEIEISTDNIALFVWLDSHDIFGRFSENGFVLVEERKIVYFTSVDDVTTDELKNVLTVRHLMSRYA